MPNVRWNLKKLDAKYWFDEQEQHTRLKWNKSFNSIEPPYTERYTG
ncbi:MAG: hypothetical protein RBQ74_02730 [Defluviitoga tunisiensis]|nr:hypothetical protein [Defluviitoga tunisiensis]